MSAATHGDAGRDDAGPRVAFFCSDFIASLWLTNRLAAHPALAGAAITVFRNKRPGAGRIKRPSPLEFRLFFYDLFDHVIQPRLRSAGRSESALMQSYEALARSGRIELIDISNANESPEAGALAERPGYVGAACLRYTEMLDRALVGRLRSRGFLWNLHGAMLPGWRGLMSLYHMRLAGCAKGAHSLHELVPEVDRGVVLTVRERAFEGWPLMLPYELALTDDTVDPIAGLIGAQISGNGAAPARDEALAPTGVYTSNFTTEEMAALRELGVSTCDARTYADTVGRAFLGEAAMADGSVLREIERYLEARSI